MTDGTEAVETNTQENEAQVSDVSSKANGEDKPDLYVEEINDPAIKARINQLYGQTKFLQRTNQILIEDNKALLDRLQKIEHKISSSETAGRANALKAARVKAFEAGDYNAVNRIDDELASLRAAPKPGDEAKKPEPSNKEDDVQLSPEETALYNSWLTEKDEGGNLRRPWALDGHPDHGRAIEIANGILADPKIAALPEQNRMGAVLQELDRLMSPRRAKKPDAPVVLSGEDKRPPKQVKLTAEEEYVAKQMGLSPEQYASAKQKYGRQR